MSPGSRVDLGSDMPFRVESLDHVELFVPDRTQAARWYHDVLGLEIVGNAAHWAANPRGPLMISSDGGRTQLALFEGTPQGGRETAGFHRVAFRVSAEALDRFLSRLPDLKLRDADGREVTPAHIVDHSGAFSLYFSDPWGHRLELTTYECDEMRARLGRSST